MKRDIFKKIIPAVMFAVSIILSWGGMIYATNDPNRFKVIGIMVSFIGYGLFFWMVIRYEAANE